MRVLERSGFPEVLQKICMQPIFPYQQPQKLSLDAPKSVSLQNVMTGNSEIGERLFSL